MVVVKNLEATGNPRVTRASITTHIVPYDRQPDKGPQKAEAHDQTRDRPVEPKPLCQEKADARRAKGFVSRHRR